MLWALELVSGPEIEPVTLAEAKRHLREYDDVTTNDADITALIQGAREWVEQYTARALIDQTWRLTFGDSVAVDRVTVPTCVCASSETRNACGTCSPSASGTAASTAPLRQEASR